MTMAKTAAQRQAAYRARRPLEGVEGNGERRLNTWLSTGASLALARLARRYGVTKREMLEQLIREQDDRIIAGLDSDTPQWDSYFGAAALLRNAAKNPRQAEEKEEKMD